MTGWVWLALPVLAWLVLWFVGRLPAWQPHPQSAAADDTARTGLGRIMAAAVAARPGLSGVRLIYDPEDALVSRLALIAAAEHCAELQYYIWRNDDSGRRLLAALRAAAGRGVRVRLLLDDNGIAGMDQLLAALDTHDNIEVRLFNPFVIRHAKIIGYLTNFRRLNHRMHNKSFTVDNQVTIVGSRNIGDEYFGRNRLAALSDLDVLAVGAIVPKVMADFDRYWTSRSVWPAARFLRAAAASESAIANCPATPLAGLPKGLTWAPVSVVSDNPAKGLGRAHHCELIGTRLAMAIGQPRQRLQLVSAYFVPTAPGVTALTDIAAGGVHVDVLTNSLQATDVGIVHAGYAPSRRPLLRAGIGLWELKGANPRAPAKLGIRSGLVRGSTFQSNGTSLHAKTFTVDSAKLFVGSFNFDPRSAQLNTEIGFIVESPELTQSLQSFFNDQVAQLAYQVVLVKDKLQWIERDGDTTIMHEKEPGTGPLQRLAIALLSRLPVKWLL